MKDRFGITQMQQVSVYFRFFAIILSEEDTLLFFFMQNLSQGTLNSQIDSFEVHDTMNAIGSNNVDVLHSRHPYPHHMESSSSFQLPPCEGYHRDVHRNSPSATETQIKQMPMSDVQTVSMHSDLMPLSPGQPSVFDAIHYIPAAGDRDGHEDINSYFSPVPSMLAMGGDPHSSWPSNTEAPTVPHTNCGGRHPVQLHSLRQLN